MGFLGNVMSEELALVPRPDLKARAHGLKPVVWIGSAGLSENVMHELDQGLRSHELIKVKVVSDERHSRTAFLNEICERLGARPVQHIGKILVIYRPQPEQIVTAEPKTVRKDRKPDGSDIKRRRLARSNRS
jgi:putative YhbY family RNA-binding protein